MSYPKDAIISLLDKANIKINGQNPWDIQIHNEDLYKRAFQQGTIGIGEAYMEGWWDCQKLDDMFCKAILSGLDRKFSDRSLPGLALVFYQSLINLQTRSRAYKVAETHYNFDNAMFEHMLGSNMNYSCGYWANSDNLEDAQQAKMDLICKKLDLRPGMKVLDIGSGWGALGSYMARKHGVDVTGVSVSKEQIEYAQEKSPECEWILDDYRNLSGKFDRVVSVGMFEHVGYKNYRVFMEKVLSLLGPDGLFLLHTIGSNYQRKGTDPWINKYIFPNGMLPSAESLSHSFANLFIMEDWHNFGADYDRTLMAWSERFENGCDANKFKHTEKMRRMFRYYLLSCAGAFRARSIQLWQVVLSPRGMPGGYRSAR